MSPLLSILALVSVSCQAAPFADWVDVDDVQKWNVLPPNVRCDYKVLDAITQHFGMSLIQSAVLDGYWEKRFEPMLTLMPIIPVAQRARYCSRWNFHSNFDGWAPHYSRNYIVAFLFKDDREEQPLIDVLWRRLAPYPLWLTERSRRQRILWVLFLRIEVVAKVII